MRIATSTIYAQQTAAIDDQAAAYADIGAQLSSGKRLNAPSDQAAGDSADSARAARDASMRGGR